MVLEVASVVVVGAEMSGKGVGDGGDVVAGWSEVGGELRGPVSSSSFESGGVE